MENIVGIELLLQSFIFCFKIMLELLSTNFLTKMSTSQNSVVASLNFFFQPPVDSYNMSYELLLCTLLSLPSLPRPLTLLEGEVGRTTRLTRSRRAKSTSSSCPNRCANDDSSAHSYFCSSNYGVLLLKISLLLVENCEGNAE